MILFRYLSKNRNNENLNTKIKRITIKEKVDKIKKIETIESETDIEKNKRIKEKEDPSRFMPK